MGQERSAAVADKEEPEAYLRRVAAGHQSALRLHGLMLISAI